MYCFNRKKNEKRMRIFDFAMDVLLSPINLQILKKVIRKDYDAGNVF